MLHLIKIQDNIPSIVSFAISDCGKERKFDAFDRFNFRIYLSTFTFSASQCFSARHWQDSFGKMSLAIAWNVCLVFFKNRSKIS